MFFNLYFFKKVESPGAFTSGGRLPDIKTARSPGDEVER